MSKKERKKKSVGLLTPLLPKKSLTKWLVYPAFAYLAFDIYNGPSNQDSTQIETPKNLSNLEKRVLINDKNYDYLPLENVKNDEFELFQITAKRLSNNNDALNYMQEQAIDNSVNPYFLFSIASMESAGNSNAKSNVGALGVMQVMTPTARDYCRNELELGKRPQMGNHLFSEPMYNLENLYEKFKVGIKLRDSRLGVDCGIAYTNYLKEHPLVELESDIFAAYNAGPGALQPSRDCPGLKKYECKIDSKIFKYSSLGVKKEDLSQSNNLKPLVLDYVKTEFDRESGLDYSKFSLNDIKKVEVRDNGLYVIMSNLGYTETRKYVKDGIRMLDHFTKTYSK